MSSGNGKQKCDFLYLALTRGHYITGARIARPSEGFQDQSPTIELSNKGKIVDSAIQKIEEKYKSVIVDKYVIMPNHIHMILLIENNEEGTDLYGGRAMRAPTISTVICQLKGYVTKQIGFSVWQKLFYDHIIRNEEDYQKHWLYIEGNPSRWAEGKLLQ